MFAEREWVEVRWKSDRPSMTMAAAIALAIGLGSAASAAPLSDVFSQQDQFTPLPNQIAPTAHHTLQWDARKGRWGIDLDVTQPTDRQADWRDARIGLNYRVAPGLRTGVGVTLGSEQPPDSRYIAPDEPAPRVRLETTFKF